MLTYCKTLLRYINVSRVTRRARRRAPFWLLHGRLTSAITYQHVKTSLPSSEMETYSTILGQVTARTYQYIKTDLLTRETTLFSARSDYCLLIHISLSSSTFRVWSKYLLHKVRLVCKTTYQYLMTSIQCMENECSRKGQDVIYQDVPMHREWTS